MSVALYSGMDAVREIVLMTNHANRYSMTDEEVDSISRAAHATAMMESGDYGHRVVVALIAEYKKRGYANKVEGA